jgi:hypothetical protein
MQCDEAKERDASKMRCNDVSERELVDESHARREDNNVDTIECQC